METETHDAAVEAIGDMIFPDDPKEEPEPKDEEYEPDPKPQVEGDDAEEPDKKEPEGDPKDPEPELVEFEFDGELLEATPKIRDALMKNQDYTQKTQTLSTDRKELEIQQGTLEHVRQQYDFAQSIQDEVAKAKGLEDQAEQAHQYLKDNIDDLSSTDIEKLRLAIDDARRERDTIVNGLTEKQQTFQQASEQAREELRNKGTEVLKARIPGWGDEKAKQLREYALSRYSEQEINELLNPTMVEDLWKASQYTALMDGKATAVKQVQTAPKIKQARQTMPKDTRRKLDLKNKLKSKSLSKEDKASLIGEDIAKSFGM